jgi:hypothetical protein
VTAFLSRSLDEWPPAARIVLGVGWLLLLIGIVLSFVVQTRVARALDRVARQTVSGGPAEEVLAGSAGTAAISLIALGLAVAAAALLL